MTMISMLMMVMSMVTMMMMVTSVGQRGRRGPAVLDHILEWRGGRSANKYEIDVAHDHANAQVVESWRRHVTPCVFEPLDSLLFGVVVVFLLLAYFGCCGSIHHQTIRLVELTPGNTCFAFARWWLVASS